MPIVEAHLFFDPFDLHGLWHKECADVDDGKGGSGGGS